MKRIASIPWKSSQKRALLGLLLAALFFASASAPARQSPEITWSPPVKISADSALSNLPRCIVSGDTIHLFWFGIDEFLTLAQDGVQYSRSTDAGASFSAPVTLLSFDVSLSSPQYAGSGSFLYAAVAAAIDTSYGAFLIRSTDGGATWEPPKLIKSAVFPRLVAADDSLAYVHYTDPVTKIHGVLTSSDWGESWRVANGAMPELTSMIVNREVIHGVGPASARIIQEIGYYFSLDGGASWIGPEILSSQDVTKSERAAISANEQGNLFSVWSDTGTVFSRASRNNGISWTPQKLLSGEGGAVTTDISAGKEFVGVAWDKVLGGGGSGTGIQIRFSNTYGASYFPAFLPAGDENASEPSITITGNIIHLTWHQHTGDACEVYYRRGATADNPDLITRPPRSYALKQNYPNPFNGTSRIEYDLPATARITLTLYTLLGRSVAVLASGEAPAGRYSVTIDGDGLPSGIYFYQLRAGEYAETKKLTIVR